VGSPRYRRRIPCSVVPPGRCRCNCGDRVGQGIRCGSLVFERFTDRARRVLVLAQEEARLMNHSFIGTEHILLGLIDVEDGIAAQALRRSGITIEAARAAVEEAVGIAGEPPSGSPPFTPRVKRVLELSLRDALQRGHSYIGTEHLLLGLIQEGEGVAVSIIADLGADLQELSQEVVGLMSGGTVGLEVGGTEGPVPAVHGVPPRCPRCRAGLADEARYKTIEVSPGDSASNAPAVSVTMVYCNRCGTGVGIA
jgi:hypothetical protein